MNLRNVCDNDIICGCISGKKFIETILCSCYITEELRNRTTYEPSKTMNSSAISTVSQQSIDDAIIHYEDSDYKELRDKIEECCKNLDIALKEDSEECQQIIGEYFDKLRLKISITQFLSTNSVSAEQAELIEKIIVGKAEILSIDNIFDILTEKISDRSIVTEVCNALKYNGNFIFID